MYIVHPYLEQPSDDARLWRYMAPTAFLSMLLGRSLFFATLESFEDPFEGVPPPAVLEAAQRPPTRSGRPCTWARRVEDDDRALSRHPMRQLLARWRRRIRSDVEAVRQVRLIGEVVLSPRMQRWQIDLFRGLLDRLAFKRPVRESSLLTAPF